MHCPVFFICLLAVALEMPGLADMNSLGLDASGVNVLRIPEDIEMANDYQDKNGSGAGDWIYWVVSLLALVKLPPVAS